MLTPDPTKQHSLVAAAVITLGILGGLVAGVLTSVNPLMLALPIFAIAIVVAFFSSFEIVVLSLLILRSSLDLWSAQQIPALLAIGLDVLAILYVAAAILTRKTIQTDNFWWFFFGWVSLKVMWIVLLPFGVLGMDSSLMSASIREWVRLFSMVMVYFLVMQLKGRIPPQRLVSILLLSLIGPLTAAAMQTFLPVSMLPSVLVWDGGYNFEAGVRINGTLGHPATFSTFTILFLGIAYWKLTQSFNKLPWLLLLGVMTFFLVGSKSLTGLSMMTVFIFSMILPRLSAKNVLGGIVLVTLGFALAGSSEFGQERFRAILDTPLLNPNIDTSRAILLAWADGNSLNWRVAQWTFLLDAWREHPILGNGIYSCSYITYHDNLAHNDYIRALAEQGIVGLFLFLLFLGVQFVRLLKLMAAAPRNGGQWTLCLVLISLLLAMMLGMATDNILTHTTFFFYWWTLFAIAGWDWQEVPNLSNPSQPQDPTWLLYGTSHR